MSADGGGEARGNVALFCTNFLPYSQSFVWEEINAHERYDVEVFAWRRFFDDRFPFARVHLANPAYIATRYSPAFHRRFREARFDLVHAHFGPGGTYAMPYAKRWDLPLVVTFHGYDVPLLRSTERAHPLNWPYAARGPKLLRQMTLGLCASKELKEMLVDLGVPEQRLRLYHLGVDLKSFHASERTDDELHVIMIGRFVEKKGFEYGVRAFARALPAAPVPTTLTLVGSGEREPRLRALVSDLGITDRVEFAGVLQKEDVATRLARSHVLLAPSVVGADGNRESGLIVVKEASACAVVPIGTWHGGIPEIIDDGQTGYLVPERDTEAMGDRLAELLADARLRARLGRAARAKMEREYDLPTQVRELERHYDDARKTYANAR